ncbi:ketosteroid isomerase [Steroidobacter agaridevorans]|uniref:Ketosteroid isomerase n=1 Tax=Steroidobacter agaridevorans TaxID=2695856 RepID=A0A829YE88_9GAMM|nr:nuclear transport factor 2 family protein [Steroidobacter agaridevorans]GFE81188.1 ketosteroid isomerase [Steroidobacter agaridevorans]GFE88928.1 ketosteroid isomerase [Steroidobacter agaridevorans]
MHVNKQRVAAALLLGWLLTSGEIAMAQTHDEIERRNVDAVTKAFDAWRTGAGSPFDLLTPEAPWTIVGHSAAAKRYPNRQSFIDEVIKPFNARMRERLIPQVHDVMADGEQVVIRFDAQAVAHDGKPYRNTYAWFLKMRDGKVVEATAFFDSIAFDDLWNRVAPQK